MKSVDEEDRDQHQAQNGIFVKQEVPQAILEKQHDQNHRRDDLYQEVMPVNPGSAIFAFTP